MFRGKQVMIDDRTVRSTCIHIETPQDIVPSEHASCTFCSTIFCIYCSDTTLIHCDCGMSICPLCFASTQMKALFALDDIFLPLRPDYLDRRAAEMTIRCRCGISIPPESRIADEGSLHSGLNWGVWRMLANMYDDLMDSEYQDFCALIGMCADRILTCDFEPLLQYDHKSFQTPHLGDHILGGTLYDDPPLSDYALILEEIRILDDGLSPPMRQGHDTISLQNRPKRRRSHRAVNRKTRRDSLKIVKREFGMIKNATRCSRLFRR